MVKHNGVFKTVVDEVCGLFLLEDADCHLSWAKECEIEVC